MKSIIVSRSIKFTCDKYKKLITRMKNHHQMNYTVSRLNRKAEFINLEKDLKIDFIEATLKLFPLNYDNDNLDRANRINDNLDRAIRINDELHQTLSLRNMYRMIFKNNINIIVSNDMHDFINFLNIHYDFCINIEPEIQFFDPLDNIDKERWYKYLIAYFKYLDMIAKYPNDIIIPSLTEDFIWHSHMQDNYAYVKDSMHNFNQILNHSLEKPSIEIIEKSHEIRNDYYHSNIQTIFVDDNTQYSHYRLIINPINY